MPAALDSADHSSREDFVAALLHESGGRPLVTIAEAARALRVEPAYLYARQRQLGAVRLGDGPRAPIRFLAQTLAERLAAAQAPASRQQPPTSPQARAPRRRRARSPALDDDLLVARDRYAGLRPQAPGAR